MGRLDKVSTMNPGHPIAPKPYTRVNQFFGVNMMEMEGMNNTNEYIQYNKIFEWMLPFFNGELFLCGKDHATVHGTHCDKRVA